MTTKQITAEFDAVIGPFLQKMSRIDQSLGRFETNAVGAINRVEAGVERLVASAQRLRVLSNLFIGAFGTEQLAKFLDQAKLIRNALQEAGDASQVAFEKVYQSSVRALAGFRDTTTVVQRFQKALSGRQTLDETIRQVETLNKLLALGGKTPQERASTTLQFSQALQAGVLQGEELRSVRENAPIDLTREIARLAGGGIEDLKKFGEQGVLTTDILIQALKNLEKEADRRFANVRITFGDAFKLFESGAIIASEAFDEGAGFSKAAIGALTELGRVLGENAEAFRTFGEAAKVAAAILATSFVGRRVNNDIVQPIREGTRERQAALQLARDELSVAQAREAEARKEVAALAASKKQTDELARARRVLAENSLAVARAQAVTEAQEKRLASAQSAALRASELSLSAIKAGEVERQNSLLTTTLRSERLLEAYRAQLEVEQRLARGRDLIDKRVQEIAVLSQQADGAKKAAKAIESLAVLEAGQVRDQQVLERRKAEVASLRDVNKETQALIEIRKAEIAADERNGKATAELAAEKKALLAIEKESARATAQIIGATQRIAQLQGEVQETKRVTDARERLNRAISEGANAQTIATAQARLERAETQAREQQVKALAKAQESLNVATAQVAAASERAAVALAATSTQARIATAALGFLKTAALGVFNFLGGWPGILLLAGTAALYFASQIKSTREALDDLKTSLDNVRNSATAYNELRSSIAADEEKLIGVQQRLAEAITSTGEAARLAALTEQDAIEKRLKNNRDLLKSYADILSLQAAESRIKQKDALDKAVSDLVGSTGVRDIDLGSALDPGATGVIGPEAIAQAAEQRQLAEKARLEAARNEAERIIAAARAGGIVTEAQLVAARQFLEVSQKSAETQELLDRISRIEREILASDPSVVGADANLIRANQEAKAAQVAAEAQAEAAREAVKNYRIEGDEIGELLKKRTELRETLENPASVRLLSFEELERTKAVLADIEKKVTATRADFASADPFGVNGTTPGDALGIFGINPADIVPVGQLGLTLEGGAEAIDRFSESLRGVRDVIADDFPISPNEIIPRDVATTVDDSTFKIETSIERLAALGRQIADQRALLQFAEGPVQRDIINERIASLEEERRAILGQRDAQGDVLAAAKQIAESYRLQGDDAKALEEQIKKLEEAKRLGFPNSADAARVDAVIAAMKADLAALSFSIQTLPRIQVGPGSDIVTSVERLEQLQSALKNQQSIVFSATGERDIAIAAERVKLIQKDIDAILNPQDPKGDRAPKAPGGGGTDKRDPFDILAAADTQIEASRRRVEAFKFEGEALAKLTAFYRIYDEFKSSEKRDPSADERAAIATEAALEGAAAFRADQVERGFAIIKEFLPAVDETKEKLKVLNEIRPLFIENFGEGSVQVQNLDNAIKKLNDTATDFAKDGANTFRELAGEITNAAREGLSFGEVLNQLLLKFIELQGESFFLSLFGDTSKKNTIGGALGSALGNLLTFADGGVMTNRGAIPLRRYSRGGIARGPQLALYGEKQGMAEAYVPLPDGRSIPVEIRRPDVSKLQGGVYAPATLNQQTNITVNGGGDTEKVIARLQQELDRRDRKMQAMIQSLQSKNPRILGV